MQVTFLCSDFESICQMSPFLLGLHWLPCQQGRNIGLPVACALILSVQPVVKPCPSFLGRVPPHLSPLLLHCPNPSQATSHLLTGFFYLLPSPTGIFYPTWGWREERLLKRRFHFLTRFTAPESAVAPTHHPHSNPCYLEQISLGWTCSSHALPDGLRWTLLCSLITSYSELDFHWNRWIVISAFSKQLISGTLRAWT